MRHVIALHMALRDVVERLGPPDSRTVRQQDWTCVWGWKTGTLVGFCDGEVVEVTGQTLTKDDVVVRLRDDWAALRKLGFTPDSPVSEASACLSSFGANDGYSISVRNGRVQELRLLVQRRPDGRV
ncbi:MAG TPA: hypothetical protein VGO93_09935 [Candidatus Xenobia bacterium]